MLYLGRFENHARVEIYGIGFSNDCRNQGSMQTVEYMHFQGLEEGSHPVFDKDFGQVGVWTMTTLALFSDRAWARSSPGSG